MMTPMTAAQIRRVRKRLGLTQEGLARALNITTSCVCLWEKGKTHPAGLYREALERFVANCPAEETESAAS